MVLETLCSSCIHETNVNHFCGGEFPYKKECEDFVGTAFYKITYFVKKFFKWLFYSLIMPYQFEDQLNKNPEWIKFLEETKS